jgi:hypothetical protein
MQRANEASLALEADILFVNAGIDSGVDFDVIQNVVKRQQRKPSVYLILVTEGGNADSGFRISRTLQSCYRRFVAVVPGWCKSTGTLMCIGAHEIEIGDFGEFGPLDVQINKQDELALAASGLTIDSSFRGLQSISFQMFERFLLDLITRSDGRITTKTAADLAANLTLGLMEPVFAQIEPMKVGEDYRFTKIAEEYALRLNAVAQNLLPNENGSPIDTLVRGYPSHGFVIDRTEASTLFRRVSNINPALQRVMDVLGTNALFPRSFGEPRIVQYLNGEASHDQPRQAPVEAGDGHSECDRVAAAEPATFSPVPSNPTKGDGKFPAEVAE